MHAGPTQPRERVRAFTRQNQTKSDIEDARMLARLGRVDPTLLSPIQHRSEAGRRALVRRKVRDALEFVVHGSNGAHVRDLRLS